MVAIKNAKPNIAILQSCIHHISVRCIETYLEYDALLAVVAFMNIYNSAKAAPAEQH